MPSTGQDDFSTSLKHNNYQPGPIYRRLAARTTPGEDGAGPYPGWSYPISESEAIHAGVSSFELRAPWEGSNAWPWETGLAQHCNRGAGAETGAINQSVFHSIVTVEPRYAMRFIL